MNEEKAWNREQAARAGSASFHRSLCDGAGFTLIELLVVVAVIAILAALGIMTLGGVNQKTSAERARSEVAALSAAVESFKIDTGSFPTNLETLYTSLCPTQAGGKVYFEPLPSMLATNLPSTNSSGQTVMAVRFIDPWGEGYNYLYFTNYFELWSTAGQTNTNNSDSWIRN
jgi:prepilin-type N-terminal cleavage/methylation domain-containing protein